MDSTKMKRVKEILQKKVQLVETLLSYAKQQSELSFTDNPVNYSNVVETRALMIEEIKKLDITLQPNLGVIGEINNDLKQQINAANDQITNLAKQIITLDEKSKALISGEMKTIKSKLHALQKGKKGLNGYNAGSKLNSAGAYTDSKR